MPNSSRVTLKDTTFNFSGNFYIGTSNGAVSTTNSAPPQTRVSTRDASTCTQDSFGLSPDQATTERNGEAGERISTEDEDVSSGLERNSDTSETTTTTDLPSFGGQQVLDLFVQLATGAVPPNTFTIPPAPRRGNNAQGRRRATCSRQRKG